MKNFIIINGTKAYQIERETKEEGLTFAQNFMDHSEEVIIREVNSFTDHTKVFEELKDPTVQKEEWNEVHHSVVERITNQQWENSISGVSNKVSEIEEELGEGGLLDLGQKLTDEFCLKYDGVVWGEDLSYLDTIESFLSDKI